MNDNLVETEIINWAKENVGGLNETPDNECMTKSYEKVYGLLIPKNPVQCHEYFMDQVFPKFSNLVKFGRKKFSSHSHNTAESIEEIYEHANLVKPLFLNFLETIFKRSSLQHNVYYFPNEHHPFFVKPEESLKFKESWKSIARVNDILRTSIVCPTSQSMEEMVMLCRNHCDEMNMNYCIINFFENCARFQEDDFKSNQFNGYMSIHFDIVFTVETPDGKSVQLMTEIQFQPKVIMNENNLSNSIKCLTHDAYRALHNGEAKAAGCYEDCQHAIEMYNAYGLSKFH